MNRLLLLLLLGCSSPVVSVKDLYEVTYEDPKGLVCREVVELMHGDYEFMVCGCGEEYWLCYKSERAVFVLDDVRYLYNVKRLD